MSKFIEFLALALGGLSLFAVCFLGFAVMSGKSLGSVPVLGDLVEQPEPTQPVVDGEPIESDRAPQSDPRQLPVVQSGVGVMGAWSLPSPFTQAELKELTNELKAKRMELEARESELDERELEVSERSQLLTERLEMLEEMSDRLEAFRDELDLREQEVSSAEKTKQRREQVKWTERGRVLNELEPAKAAERIVSYDPEEAAQILRAMEPTTAYEVINSIEGDWQAYLDAYTELAPAGERP